MGCACLQDREGSTFSHGENNQTIQEKLRKYIDNIQHLIIVCLDKTDPVVSGENW